MTGGYGQGHYDKGTYNQGEAAAPPITTVPPVPVPAPYFYLQHTPPATDPFSGWTAQDEALYHLMRPVVPGTTS